MVRFTASAIALAGLASTALATITINSPSSSSYWVQFSSNTISWTYGSGDPSSVSIDVVNSNSSFLNGVFSIAEYVDTSIQSYTITNVTLKLGDNYQVQFVDPTNSSIIYATSGTFSVQPNGTAPAPSTTSASAAATASGMAFSVSASASGTSASASSSAKSPAAVVKADAVAALASLVFALSAVTLL